MYIENGYVHLNVHCKWLGDLEGKLYVAFNFFPTILVSEINEIHRKKSRTTNEDEEEEEEKKEEEED